MIILLSLYERRNVWFSLEVERIDRAIDVQKREDVEIGGEFGGRDEEN